MTSLLDEALALARRGLRVHPVRGKVPLLKEWPKRATSDEPTIRELWREYPDANVGVLTGVDGLFVLDVDVAKGGTRSLNFLASRHGQLPRTPLVRTGGGGWHLYLRASFDVRNSASKLGAGLDIRGVGGHVVAPPSVHVSGRRYEWVVGYSIEDAPIASAPEWLSELLWKLQQPKRGLKVPASFGPADAEAMERARRYLARMPAAISGSGGHDATWAAALVLVRGFALSEAQALDLLAREFNPRCEPPWNETELRHKVRSAAEKGAAEIGFLLRERAA